MKRFSKGILKAVVVLGVALAVPTLAWATGQVVTGNVNFNASFGEAVSSGFPTSNTLSQAVQQIDNYANGTGSAQIDTLYAKQITLVASTPQTLDLTTVTDPAGNSANFARVREAIFQNVTTTASYDVKVSAGASNGVIFLPPSSSPLFCRYGSTLRISDKVSTGSGNGNVVGGTTKTVTLDPGTNGPIIINVIIAGGSSAFVFILVIPGLRRYRRIAA